MFHAELRQFPYATRAFNLSRQELDARIVGPWVRGHAVELDDRRWSPDRAKLVIYEGRALATEEIGMGRGWSNVTRTGEDVTERVVQEVRGSVESPPTLETIKREILARAPIDMAQLLQLVGDLEPGTSDSERLELAARSIWELLQAGSLTLSRPG